MSLTAAAVVIIVLLVALTALGVAFWRMNRDVERILTRLRLPTDTEVAARALDRGVRELERDNERITAEAAALRAAIDETALGIVIFDTARVPIVANPVGEVVLAGRTGEAVLRRELLEAVELAATTGEAALREVDLYAPAHRAFRIRAVPIDDGGGVVAYVRDLSEQMRVDALRRDFVTNAGHELKTPLGAIAVLAETLQDVEDPEQRRRLAERLTDESRRLADVVDDILVLGAIESGTTPFEPVNVADVIDSASDRVSLHADAAHVKVVTEFGRSDLIVDGNPEQLVSAVVNLLDNAVKYSGPGSQVTCILLEDGDEVVIRVEDNGIGIADQYLDRVFERFFRIDRGRSRESGGTGLGLSIVRNVARTHGGSVSVESEPGTGSTFEIRLPKASNA